MTAIPARGRRRPRDRRGLPAAGPDGDVRRARGRRHAAVPHRRRARDRGAGLRHGDPARRQDRRAGQRLRRGRQGAGRGATARSISSPARARSRSSSTAGAAAWIAADLIAQAEHDPDARAILVTPVMTLARPSPRRSRASCPDGPGAPRAGRNGGIIVTHDARRGDRAQRSAWRRSTLVCDSRRRRRAAHARAGTVFVGALQRAGRRRLRHRLEPRAADRRRRRGPRRPERRRLRARRRRSARSPPRGLRRDRPAGIALAEAEGLGARADPSRIRRPDRLERARAMTYTSMTKRR